MSSNDSLWCLRTGVSFQWREWDGEYIVFECSSGNLHMLDAATACILKLLSQNALSQENMATALVDAGYGEPSTDLRLFVRQAINTLQSLRLVCTSEQSVP